MNAGPSTIVAVGALSFAIGIFLSLMCWDKAGVESKIDVDCPNGRSPPKMMLLEWSPPVSHAANTLVACDDRGRAARLQLANFAEHAASDSTGARIKP